MPSNSKPHIFSNNDIKIGLLHESQIKDFTKKLISDILLELFDQGQQLKDPLVRLNFYEHIMTHE